VSKFAPITAGLLTRKGQAGPSILTGAKNPFAWHGEALNAPPPSERPESGSVIPMHEDMAPAKAPPRRTPPAPGAKRKISLALSPQEHETLGIVAVKRGVTRNQVLREALDGYLERLADEFRTQCGCIASGCACTGTGTNAA
jgi:hypothetical protein